MITLAVVVALVLAFVAVIRYGADTRVQGADHRDPARPRGPQYAHTPAQDLRLLAGLARRVAGQRQLWAAYDHALRPWETERVGVRPVA